MNPLRDAADQFHRVVDRDPIFRWLATGGNVFYPLAAIFLVVPLICIAQGYTTSMHVFAEVAMFALGLVCLVYAGFSEPR